MLDTSNLIANKIDTIKYSNLLYWGNTTMDRFHSAYVDTFSVDGNKFRFINPNPLSKQSQLDIIVYLEKLINNKWVFTGLTLQTRNHVYDFYHSKDINGDGFVDITQDEKWMQAVYFYDPKTKTYLGSGDPNNKLADYVNYELKLIDTAKKIFCDFHTGKLMCGDIHSKLYTYNGLVKEDLYDLEFCNCIKENDRNIEFVRKLILSKCIHRKNYDPTIFDDNDSLVKIKEIPLSKPIDLYKDVGIEKDYFGYAKFWKGHYKSLLGYR